MDELLKQVIADVLKECASQNISVRQFLMGIGENDRTSWNALLYKPNPSKGKLHLLLKLLKYFNYDKRKEN